MYKLSNVLLTTNQAINELCYSIFCKKSLRVAIMFLVKNISYNRALSGGSSNNRFSIFGGEEISVRIILIYFFVLFRWNLRNQICDL